MRPILVVGNDQMRQRFAAILSRTGYQVIEAESGETAIDLALSLLPEVVLMAILLPQLNGLETAARLRTLSELQAVSIILLGSIAPIGLNDEPLASLIDGYLSTDASPDELLECVRKCANN
jgi:sigma-B regulation protein RsbU (phosphoserine phosphatase)